MKRLGGIMREKFGTTSDRAKEHELTDEEAELQREYEEKISEYAKRVYQEKTEIPFLEVPEFKARLKQQGLRISKEFQWSVIQPYSRMMFGYCMGFDEWYKAGEEFLLNEPSLDKGILLIGSTGCGKSTIFDVYKSVCQNAQLPNPIKGRFVSANDMHLDFNASGSESIRKYFTNDLIIDDFGTEEIASHFGNKVEAVRMVVEQRYLNAKSTGIKTHASTNLTPEEIGNKYGSRVRSRLKEMFNVIRMKGTDLRK